MSKIPEISEIPDSPLTVAARKIVGDDDDAQYLLLYALLHKVIPLNLNLPKQGWPLWSPLPQLGIPIEKYADLVIHLKATRLVEFRRNGRMTNAIRLNAAGEEWARSERLLPKQATAQGSRQT
jgi:hypothetical protein